MATYEGTLDVSDEMEMAVVVSRFNEDVSHLLLQGAKQVLDEKGIKYHIVWVPGAFELPLAARRLAHSMHFDALICLGSVIRGETAHFDYVANESARGIAEASAGAETPIIFGVLTTETRQQALVRADPLQKNKGGYSANTAIEMVNLYRGLHEDHLLEPFTPEDFFIDFDKQTAPFFEE